MKKSEGRKLLESLSRNDLEYLIQNNTLKEIGLKYNVAYTCVRNVAQKRNIFKYGSLEHKRIIKDEFSKEDYIKSHNAWMLSKERLFLQTIKNNELWKF